MVPYVLQGHRELFNDDVLIPFLDGVNIKTDEQRIQEVSHYFLHHELYLMLISNVKFNACLHPPATPFYTENGPSGYTCNNTAFFITKQVKKNTQNQPIIFFCY